LYSLRKFVHNINGNPTLLKKTNFLSKLTPPYNLYILMDFYLSAAPAHP
jgi:hypothetical protein